MQKTQTSRPGLFCLFLSVFLLLLPAFGLAAETAAPTPSAEPLPLEEISGQYLQVLSEALNLQADTATPSPAPVVDTEEAYAQYLLRRAEMLNTYGGYASWPLEQRAELDQFRLDAGLVDAATESIYSLPSPEEITKDEAFEIARETVREEFELEERSSMQWYIGASFFRKDGQGLWVMDLRPSVPSSDGVYYTYHVEMEADTGDPIWFVATEYLGENAAVVPDSDVPSAEPGAEDISLDAALAVGQEVLPPLMAQNVRWSDAFLPVYAMDATFQKDFPLDDGQAADVWVVTYTASDPVIGEYFGDGRLVLDAKTGEVLQADVPEAGEAPETAEPTEAPEEN